MISGQDLSPSRRHPLAGGAPPRGLRATLEDMQWDNSFVRDLGWLGARVDPVPVADPHLLALDEDLARELGADPEQLRSDEGVEVLAGNRVATGSQPIAQAYAGHQFGQLSPLLGDGRAHLLGEVVDIGGRRRDVALKGSGRTPFSRGGDGRAAIGPVLREYLVSGFMHAVGVPTTRSLAAVATGEQVRRERPLPGAVLTRVASSHLRIGTVVLLATQGSREQLGALVEHVRARHHPHVAEGDVLDLFASVLERHADLVAAWMSLGFVHGVMNTDNMTLSGETIDYGPCAFLDTYAPEQWFSSIDHTGRYRYSQQPTMAAWGLARLAEALVPLAQESPDDAVTRAQSLLDGFDARYQASRLDRARAALGLTGSTDDRDGELVAELQGIARDEELDHTGLHRDLARLLRGEQARHLDEVEDRERWAAWERTWRERVASTGRTPHEAAEAMDRVTPVYIPRNHLVEEALAAAEGGDLAPFAALDAALRDPFVERPGRERLAEPAPRFTRDYVTYCGT